MGDEEIITCKMFTYENNVESKNDRREQEARF